VFQGFTQGRINHWANRDNARGLALEYWNTAVMFFHVFKLFTTRQNCRAFWLLRLRYTLRKLTTLAFKVLSDLKSIEPNSTTLYDRRIDISASMGVRRIFSRGATPKFCLSFSGCWRCNTNGRSQNALSFLPISLCWVNLNTQFFVWNVFCTSAIRNTFYFHKHPNIH